MPKYVLNPETLLYEEKEDPKYLKHVHWAVAIVVAAALIGFLFFGGRKRSGKEGDAE